MVIHWIIAHIIGDYILQSDYIAVNKKKSSWVAVWHVLLYLLPFIALNQFWGIEYWKIFIIGLQHFIQDRTNFVIWSMKALGKKDFANFKIFGPWGIILMDNVYHIVFISIIWIL